MKQLQLVDDPTNKQKKAKKHAEPRFDSGSDRDSQQQTIHDIEEEEQFDDEGEGRFDVDLTYKPIVIDKCAQNLNQFLNSAETKDEQDE